MFKSQIVTETIPERIFALYLVLKNVKKIDKAQMKEMFEPKNIKSTNYFNACLNTVIELKLAYVEGTTIILNKEYDNINSYEDFRLYVISNIETEALDGVFNQITNMFFNPNIDGNYVDSKEILKFSSINEISKYLPKIDNKFILGWRFWAAFLNFGYLSGTNNTIFYPNCAGYIKNALSLTNLKKNERYTIDEFINELLPYSKSLLGNCVNTKKLNFGVSSALRTLHDQGVIKLYFINDQQSVWTLDFLRIHEFSSEITHVTIL